MSVDRVLTSAVLVVALMSLFGETTSDAQQHNVRVNGVSASTLPAGLEKTGAVWSFKTAVGGPHAPTILGILTPPLIEPTLESDSGAMWLYCAGPTESTTCILKVNVLGTPFEMARATWSLE